MRRKFSASLAAGLFVGASVAPLAPGVEQRDSRLTSSRPSGRGTAGLPPRRHDHEQHQRHDDRDGPLSGAKPWARRQGGVSSNCSRHPVRLRSGWTRPRQVRVLGDRRVSRRAGRRDQLRPRGAGHAPAPAGARCRGDAGHATLTTSSPASRPTEVPRWAPRPSTRALEGLDRWRIVGHHHLDRAASYHLADHADHIHLVCQSCGRVEQCDRSSPTPSRGNVLTYSGFVAD